MAGNVGDVVAWGCCYIVGHLAAEHHSSLIIMFWVLLVVSSLYEAVVGLPSGAWPQSPGMTVASWPSSDNHLSTFPVSTDYVSRYEGPIAVPLVLPDGTIADTPEVHAAKEAHLLAVAKASQLWHGPQDDGSYDPHKYEENSYHHSSAGHYSGPLATATVLPSGHLADTADNSAAKGAHLTALWKAQQEAEKWKSQGWNGWQ